MIFYILLLRSSDRRQLLQMHFFAILAIIFSVIMTMSAQSCDPYLDCDMIHIPGETVPDPKNCEKFYICFSDESGNIYPSTASAYCPSGQYFNPMPSPDEGCLPETIQGICDINYCGKVLAPNRPDCVVDCPGTFPAAVADPADCSSYYECSVDGNKLSRPCPSETPFYDGELCRNDSSLCCDFTTPYCRISGTIIPDPTDCASYYVCGGANEVPSESYKLTCPEGQIFNAANYKCEPGTCELSTQEASTTTIPAASTTTTKKK